MKRLLLDNIFEITNLITKNKNNFKINKILKKNNYFVLDFWFTFYDGKTITIIHNIKIDSIDFKNDFKDILI